MNQPVVLDTSTATARPKRRKRLYRVLWALLVLGVGVGLFWTWSYYAALAERDALIAELHAKGEPVWWHDVVDKLLAEPTEDTGAEYYLKAVWALGGDYNPAGPRLPNGVLWNAIDNNGVFLQPPVVSEQPTVDANVQQQVRLSKPAFDFLEQAVQRKPSLLSANTNGRPLKNSDPFTYLLPHIQDSRALIRMNFWRVYDALAWRVDAEAYHAAWVGLAASEQLSKEPWITAQFVRLHMQSQACRQLLMCLEYAAVPEVEFQRIDAFFASLEDSFRLEAIMQADRALGVHLWSSGDVTKEVILSSAFIRRSSNPFQDSLAKGWLAILGSPLVAPSRIETQEQELRFYGRIEGMVDRPNVDLKEIDDAVAEYEAAAPIYGLIEVPAGKSKSARTFAMYVIAAHRRLILHRLALRLRRYSDRHGRFPDRLDNLCDASMPSIRLDWFRDHPITYAQSTDGFRLEVADAVQQKFEKPVEVKLKTRP